MKKDKESKITLSLKGRVIELTSEEFEELKKIMGPAQVVWYPVTVAPQPICIPQPYPVWPYPYYTITCQSNASVGHQLIYL